jgi:hypothetical protein
MCNKRSSLVQKLVNYSCKKFYTHLKDKESIDVYRSTEVYEESLSVVQVPCYEKFTAVISKFL